jgi:hypothetical protein
MDSTKQNPQRYNDAIVGAPVLLFLGAGASFDLGKPLMGAFLDGVQGSLGGEVADLVSCIRRERGSDLEAVLEDLQELTRLSYVTSFATRTIDQQATAARISSQFMPGEERQFPVDDSPVFKPVDFNRLIVLAALMKLREAIIVQYATVDESRVHVLCEPLLSKVFAGTENKLLPIFTTNYEPAIEHFCEHDRQARMHLINGFDLRGSGSQTRVWRRSVFDSSQPAPSKRNVALFKMHGSADWNRDKMSNEIRLGLPIYLENDRFENTVIYLATRKVAFQEPYSTAYDYFQRCCEKAFLCITIGYSFRDYDALTRPGPCFYQLRRASEPQHAYGYAPLYPAYKCLQQEDREPSDSVTEFRRLPKHLNSLLF